MANLFHKIAERALGLADTVQPLLPSMYESLGFDSYTHFQNKALDSGSPESKDNSESLQNEGTLALFSKQRPTPNRQVSQDILLRIPHTEEVLDPGLALEGSDLGREHVKQESDSARIEDNSDDGISLHSTDNKTQPEGFDSGADHRGASQYREQPLHNNVPKQQTGFIRPSFEITNSEVAKEGLDLFHDSERKRVFAAPEPQKTIRHEVIVKREVGNPLPSEQTERVSASHALTQSVRKSAQPIQMEKNLTERRLPVPESVKAAPTIKVIIGRIEVKAVMQQAPPKQTIKPHAPKLSLDDYLKQRNGGKK